VIHDPRDPLGRKTRIDEYQAVAEKSDGVASEVGDGDGADSDDVEDVQGHSQKIPATSDSLTSPVSVSRAAA
jgi:hypothetical protein